MTFKDLRRVASCDVVVYRFINGERVKIQDTISIWSDEIDNAEFMNLEVVSIIPFNTCLLYVCVH